MSSMSIGVRAVGGLLADIDGLFLFGRELAEEARFQVRDVRLDRHQRAFEVMRQRHGEGRLELVARFALARKAGSC